MLPKDEKDSLDNLYNNDIDFNDYNNFDLSNKDMSSLSIEELLKQMDNNSYFNENSYNEGLSQEDELRAYMQGQSNINENSYNEGLSQEDELRAYMQGQSNINENSYNEGLSQEDMLRAYMQGQSNINENSYNEGLSQEDILRSYMQGQNNINENSYQDINLENNISLKEDNIEKELDIQDMLEDLYEEQEEEKIDEILNKKENLNKKEKNQNGFLNNILSKIINRKDNSNINSNYNYEESKFKEYIFLLEDSEEEEGVLRAVEICDDSLKLDRHKLYLDKKLKEFEVILEDIKCYDNLTDDEADFLKTLIDKYIHLNNERRNIRYQMGDFNSSINKLENLKEDAEDAMSQIENAEKRKRLLTRDIQIIKDEKERTLTDRERMQIAYKILYKFSFIISIVLGFAIIFLTLLSIATNQSVFLPLSIICITLVFSIVLIYAIRKKLIFEIKLNEKKYSKIIALLNKKTVVVSHYINFLNFVYKKYNVKSARNLKNNLEDFNNYKHIITRYDNLGKLVFEVQKQLEDFLFEKKISIKNTSLEAFAKSINIDNKILYFKEISLKRENVLKRIEEIEREQKVLMDELNNINEEDTTKEQIVDKIIKAYVNETQKLLSEEDEEEIEKLNYI